MDGKEARDAAAISDENTSLRSHLAAAEQARITLQAELNDEKEARAETEAAMIGSHNYHCRRADSAEGDRRALQIALAQVQEDNQKLKEELARNANTS